MGKGHFVLVQNQSEYEFQKQCCDKLSAILTERGYEVTIVRRDEYPAEHLFISELNRQRGQVLFTIDMTGFECRTVGDDISYNGMAYHMFHLLTKAPWEYEELNDRYNFTMFFAVTSDAYRNCVKNYYKRIIHIETLKKKEADQALPSDSENDVWLPLTPISSSEIYSVIETLPDVFLMIAKYCIAIMQKFKEISLDQAVELCLKEIQYDCQIEEKLEIFRVLNLIPMYLKMCEYEQNHDPSLLLGTCYSMETIADRLCEVLQQSDARNYSTLL
ncbi:MAG: hypothetical protein GX567_05190 [Clostridia bacterium]|nr:hypothetical protein [Clostridia bacterium]